MFRSLIFTVLAFASVSAFAQVNPCLDIPAATKDKTASEIAVILESCRPDANSVIKSIPSVTPEKASEWANAAKEFAGALGIAARELGIATNDFLDSPAGYLLAALLVLNYAGGFLGDIMIGLPFTILTMWGFYVLFRRLTTNEIKYENVPIFWGFTNIRRKVSVSTSTLRDDGFWILFWGTGVLIILNLIVWINI